LQIKDVFDRGKGKYGWRSIKRFIAGSAAIKGMIKQIFKIVLIMIAKALESSSVELYFFAFIIGGLKE